MKNAEKRIIVLVPKGNIVASSLVSAIDMYEKTSNYMQSAGIKDKPMFEVSLVGYNDHRTDNRLRFDCIAPEGYTGKPDLVIIPASNGDLMANLETNSELKQYLVKWYKAGAEIASLCIGAFLLAETGLIDGKSCTTHWSAAAGFKARYPKINLVADKIITDEDGIYTSGGAFSHLHLHLYIIEKYCGRAIAIWASKLFQIDLNRSSQSVFSIFHTQKMHDDEEIKKAQNLIEQQLHNRINVGELAAGLAMSTRTFIRRFKTATGNTPIEYIQRVKIEAAKRALETGGKNVNEVVYDLGYNDNKAFRKIFKKYTGLSPVNYKEKFTRIVSA